MLVKAQRLVKDKDFTRVFKRGASFYGKLFGVRVMPNCKNSNRYGIIINLKVSKKAVDRNLLKRQIRALLREFDQKFVKGIDLVVVVLPAILGVKYKIIQKEFEQIFKKLKLFK